MNRKKWFGQALRRLRRGHKLTLRQIAEVAGNSVPLLSDIELERRGPLVPSKIERVLAYIGAEDQLGDMLMLAGMSRASIKIPIEEQPDYVASTVVTFAQCCEAGIDEATARELVLVLKKRMA